MEEKKITLKGICNRQFDCLLNVQLNLEAQKYILYNLCTEFMIDDVVSLLLEGVEKSIQAQIDGIKEVLRIVRDNE